MFDDKKRSFVLYTDYIGQIDKLTDQQAGALFKAIMHHAAGSDPVELDPLSDMVFDFIRQHMERDGQHYRQICEKRREAAQKKQLPANGSKCKQMHANDGDNDNDNVNDNENDNGNDNENDNENDNDVLAALASISTPTPKRKTKFSNFPERTYTNFDELERLLLNAD